MRGIAARYESDAAQTIPNASSAIVNFEDRVYDPHNLVTIGANWRFQPRRRCYLHISAAVMFQESNAWADGEVGSLTLSIDGDEHSVLDHKDNLPTASLYMQLSGSDDVYLEGTEDVAIRVFQESGGPLDLQNHAIYTYVAIHEITPVQRREIII